jgi:hypothetical protein
LMSLWMIPRECRLSSTCSRGMITCRTDKHTRVSTCAEPVLGQEAWANSSLLGCAAWLWLKQGMMLAPIHIRELKLAECELFTLTHNSCSLQHSLRCRPWYRLPPRQGVNCRLKCLAVSATLSS